MHRGGGMMKLDCPYKCDKCGNFFKEQELFKSLTPDGGIEKNISKCPMCGEIIKEMKGGL